MMTKNIELVMKAPDGIKIRANITLLRQAIVNIIENAVAYSKEGKVSIEIEKINGEICITVKDEGIGIEPKFHGRIFERFFRVDKSRNRSTGGAGLGLAIVKHIMLAHKGRVDVTSSLGEGSRFSLFFPGY